MNELLLVAETGHRYGTHLIGEARAAHDAWYAGVAPRSHPVAFARMAAEQLTMAARALAELEQRRQPLEVAA